MKHNILKRTFAGVLAVLCAAGAVPAVSAAEADTAADVPAVVVSADAVSYVGEGGAVKEQTKVVPMTESTAELADGWYIVDSDVAVNSVITVKGKANLILADGKTLTAKKGINIAEGELNIFCQKNGTGKLSATGVDGDGKKAGTAAINGTVNIYGGVINAVGGAGAQAADNEAGKKANAGMNGGAGISGKLTVYGGDITATGGNGGQGGRFVKEKTADKAEKSVNKDTAKSRDEKSAKADKEANAGGNGGAGGNGIYGTIIVNGGKFTLAGGKGGNGGKGETDGAVGADGRMAAGTVTINDGVFNAKPKKDWVKGEGVYIKQDNFWVKVKLTETPAVDPTFTKAGNAAYYTAEDEKYYMFDGENYYAVEKDAWVIPAVTIEKLEAKEPTCTEDGNIECWLGSEGKYYLPDGDNYTEAPKETCVIPAKGHVCSEPVWEWKDDNTAVAKLICENCGGELAADAEVTAETTAPTFEAAGKTVYTAKAVFNDVEYTDVREVTLDKLEISFEKVEAKAAVCEADGNREYYKGSDGKFYVAENGTFKEIAENSWVIPKKSHHYTIEVSAPTTAERGYTLHTCSECGHSYKDNYISRLPAITDPTYEAGDGCVTISWNAIEGAENYAVCGYVSGKWRKLDDEYGTSYEISGLKEGAIYKVAVLARVENTWNKYFTSAITVTPDTEYPVVEPTVMDNKFRLTWSEVENAQQYGIAVYQAGKWELLTKLDSDTTTALSPELEPGTYKMAVCARIKGRWDTRCLDERALDVTIE